MLVASPNNSRMKFLRRFFTNPMRVIVTSFAGMILFGTILLMLPASSRSGNPTSVSYTHLDVYKRQALILSPQRFRFPTRELPLAPAFKIPGRNYPSIPSAVSYTHLQLRGGRAGA